MDWEDSDEQREKEYLNKMLDSERKQLMFASSVRLMESLLKTYSVDDARRVAIEQVRQLAQEFYT